MRITAEQIRKCRVLAFEGKGKR